MLPTASFSSISITVVLVAVQFEYSGCLCKICLSVLPCVLSFVCFPFSVAGLTAVVVAAEIGSARESLLFKILSAATRFVIGYYVSRP